MKIILGNQSSGEATNHEEQIVETKEEVVEAMNSIEEKTVSETSVKSNNAMNIRRHFLYEDKGRRGLNAKHYVGNDGTLTAVYSNRAVHYVDEETKELKEIDNSLSDVDGVMETKANTFKTRFKKRSADGEIFEMTKGKCRVGLKSHDLAKRCNCELDNCTCKETNETSSELLFENASDNTDLQYIVDSDRVKENIIVKEKDEKYEYNFGINIENLDVGISDDGKTLELKDKESGEVKFYIPAPFMKDANGVYSNLVCYEIAEQSGDALSLKVIADAEWMNAEERAFPVIIDPQVVSCDSSLFKFEYYGLMERKTSGGTSKEWVLIKNNGSELSSKRRVIITIRKGRLPLLQKSITSVKISLYTEYDCVCYAYNKTYGCVKDGFCTRIDITDAFKKTSSDCVITLESENAGFYVGESGRYSPQLQIEYLNFEAEIKDFSLVDKVTGKLNETTGELVTEFSDINAGSTVLPLQISHVHKKSEEYFLFCGQDWRLNLHQTLEKVGDDYVYTDAIGQKHTVNEVYYYVEDSVRHVIDKNEVAVQPDGSLTCISNYCTHTITRELRTDNGLRVSTKLEGLKYVEFFEQQQEDEKKLSESISSYAETLNSLCCVKKDDLSVKVKSNSISHKQVEKLLSSVDNSSAILTSSEYAQIANMQNTIDVGCEKGLKQYYNDQIKNIWANATGKPEQVSKLYKEYLSQTEQLNQMQRALPVSYIINDETGTILCFNKFGKLCAVIDRYENKIIMEWNNIEVYGGFEEAITTVYDGDHVTNFQYNEHGQLTSITAPNGERVEYTYGDDASYNQLKKVKYSDGSMIYFNYNSDGEIDLVRANDCTYSKQTYDGYRLKKITKYSSLNKVTDTSKAISESGMESSAAGQIANDVTITYGTDYICCTSDNVAEYTIFGEKGNENIYIKNGSYTKVNDKMRDFTLVRYVPREYQFSVSPKKKNKMSGDAAVVDAEVGLYLGLPLPSLQSLPGMTSEYTTFVEADWEHTALDSFNRPTLTKTNWRYIGKTPEKNNVYSYSETEYTYDADNENYPCIKKTVTEYINLKGQKSINDAKKKVYVEEYSYCEHGNLVKTESYVEGEEGTSGVTVTEKVCDDKGNIIKEFTYNTLDSSTKFYTQSEYAENGNVTAEIDETGENKTSVEYVDGTTTVKTQVMPNGSKFSYGYDESGNITAITQSTVEGEENSTNVKYTLNCPTRLTSGNNEVYYEYDHKRRLTKVTVNSTETSYAYSGSKYDDIASVKSPAVTIGGESFTAKAADMVSTKRGNVTTKVYTDKDGNIAVTEINNKVQAAYEYNQEGGINISADTVTQSVIRYTYQQTPERLLESVTIGAGENVEALTESYLYNNHGEISNKTYTDAVSQTYGYYYKENAARDIDHIALPNGLNSYPLKDVNGRETGKELKDDNGDKKYGEYIYYRKVGDHGTNMPSALYYGTLKNNKYVISDNLKYKYDKIGNIAEVYENGVLAAKYTYDSIGRLVREDNKKFRKSYFYTYDNCGNILFKREAAYTVKAEEKISDYTGETQYCYDGDRLIQYNGETFEYDIFGNPLNYKGKKLEWQYGKRLVKYGDLEFAYDGYGRRIKKDNIVYTYDSNGTLLKQTDGEDTLEFIYDNGGLCGFKHITNETNEAVETNETHYIYRKNIQGDITAIINEEGNEVARYSYDAWGNHAALDADGNDIIDPKHIGLLNPFRYRGYYYDDETGLYYLQTRYYDPEIGRFISQDDVSYLDPEHINGLNLYAYCLNNPVMMTDPDGTIPKWLKWLFFGLAVAVIAVAAVVACVATGGAALVAAAVAIGGIASMGGNLIEQGLTKGWNNIDVGELGIYGLSGALYGAACAVTGGAALVVAKTAIAALTGMTMTAYKNENATLVDVLSSGLQSAVASLVIQGAAHFAGKGIKKIPKVLSKYFPELMSKYKSVPTMLGQGKHFNIKINIKMIAGIRFMTGLLGPIFS